MKNTKLLILFCLCICHISTSAQYYSHTAGLDTAAMRLQLEGQGVKILNLEIKCLDVTQGSYQGVGNLGIDTGVVLSLGKVDSVFVPLDPWNPFYYTGAPTEIGLKYINREFIAKKGISSYVIAGVSCGIEFDIIPANDLISIPYIYADVGLDSSISTILPSGNWKMVTESSCHCVPHVNLMGIFVTGGSYGTDTVNYAILPQDDGYGPIPVNRYTLTLDKPLFDHFCSSHETDTMFWGPLARRHFVRYNTDGYLLPNVNYPGLTVPLTADIPVTPCDTFHIAMGVSVISAFSPCGWGSDLNSAMFIGAISSPGTADTCATIGTHLVPPHTMGIYLSPNPFQDKVQLRSTDPSKIYAVQISDMLGRTRIQLQGTAAAMMDVLNSDALSTLPSQQHYIWQFTDLQTHTRSSMKLYKQ